MPVNDGLFPLEPVAVDKPPRGQRRRPERPRTDRQVSLFSAELVGPRAGGPGYRISGKRRLAVLADLLGTPPPGALPDGWPADPGANS